MTVAAATIVAATAAPLADVQRTRTTSYAEAVASPQRAVQTVERKPVPVPRLKVRQQTVPQPAPKPKPRPKQPAEARTTIGGYRVCNQAPQPCIDSGTLTLYGQPYGVNILAGHNYQGFQWLSRLPVGRTVVVTSGQLAGTYRVTGHLRLNRQSGNLPSFGGADLVLQSCEGDGTGFSLLHRTS